MQATAAGAGLCVLPCFLADPDQRLVRVLPKEVRLLADVLDDRPCRYVKIAAVIALVFELRAEFAEFTHRATLAYFVAMPRRAPR